LVESGEARDFERIAGFDNSSGHDGGGNFGYISAAGRTLSEHTGYNEGYAHVFDGSPGCESTREHRKIESIEEYEEIVEKYGVSERDIDRLRSRRR